MNKKKTVKKRTGEFQDVEEEMKLFEALLKKEGLKVTAQRLLVAETIFSIHSHFTADSLLDMFRDRRDEISKATIYRILGIMVEAKLLMEHNFGKDYKFYEHIVGHSHHDHIICSDCGRIEEFMDERIEAIQEEVCSKKGFKIKGHSLNVYGECLKKQDCEHFKASEKAPKK